ncbi:MAG TPA: methyltransferase, FxLD system [Mycobacteriales bacterium]|jgi:protein-L-isoaspartate(D-aspartate) O-methyltransferase|nr:methyltransferase, FxLD system [Mycobacteriales bacterium]
MTEALRERLVGHLVSTGRITSAPLAEAFRMVPRHLFLPGTDPAVVYQDEAIPTRWSSDGRPTSSSSQPAIVAAMLEQLGLRPGHRVLEIGSGTGWNAALLAYLVGPAGAVSTVDIEPAVAGQAARNLTAAGATGVRVVVGDGSGGDPETAPFDRIVVTASARDLAPAWSAQLADGGRLVLPLSLRGAQSSVAFEPAGDHLESVSIVPAGFMPMQGTLAGPDPLRPLGRRDLMLHLDDPRPVDTDALLAALDAGGGPITPVPVRRAEVHTGLRVWLALRAPDAGDLVTLQEPATSPTPVLVGDGALAALVPTGSGTGVRGYGPDGDALAARLLTEIEAWIAAGRPGTTAVRIRAYPAGTDLPPPTIDTPNTRFTVDWPAGQAGS